MRENSIFPRLSFDQGKIFLNDFEVKGVTKFKLEKNADAGTSTLSLELKVLSTLDQVNETASRLQHLKRRSLRRRLRNYRP